MLNGLIRKDVKAVDKKDPIRSILGNVLGDTRTRTVVLDGQRPYGIPNQRALMGRNLNDRSKVEKFTMPTPVLTPSSDRYAALAVIDETLAAYLPVEENGRLRGIVDPLDLVADLEDGPTAGDAAEIVPALKATATIGEAITVFHKVHVDHLPVLDGNGRLCGALARSAVIRLEGQARESRGRQDYATDSIHMHKDAVGGFMDDAFIEAPADLDCPATAKLLRDAGYAIVRLERHNGGETYGVVTPAYLARACNRQKLGTSLV